MPIKPKENDYAAIMQIVSLLTKNNPLSEHLLYFLIQGYLCREVH